MKPLRKSWVRRLKLPRSRRRFRRPNFLAGKLFLSVGESLEPRLLLDGQGFDFPGGEVPSHYAVESPPKSVTAADFDGDGYLDLVTANAGSTGTVSVLRNLGDGTFTTQAAYAVGSSPASVTAADFNGDGFLDLVTANAGSGTVSVLQNLGDGTFAAQAAYAVGVNPASVTAADFDGDGCVDLVTANFSFGTVSVLRNLGDGTFAAQTVYTVLGNPASVTAADFDGDGSVDLVTANAGTSGAVSVLQNLGDGTFAAQAMYAVGGAPTSVSAVDFDGDGHVDLVTANGGSGTVSVLRNVGDGTFAAQTDYAAGSSPASVTAADFDGDGHVDLVTANYADSGTVSVLRNLGDGTFAAQVVYAVRSYPRSVTAADFDGDGHLDLVTANFGSGTVSVLRNLGDGTFAAQTIYAVGDNPISVTAADFDGDGHLDLVTANFGSGTASVLRNLGDGTFATQKDYAVGSNPQSVKAADFDGDGHLDLVTANAGSGTVSALRNLGDGTFAAHAAYAVGITPRSVTAADFDGDGHLDLVAANGGSDTVSVLRNLGDGTFAAQVVYVVGSNPQSITPTDIDGDGHVDIATANAGSNTVSVLRNLGDGTFAAQTVYAAGSNPVSVTAADFDGDGHLDLVAANGGSDTVSVLRNLGDGTFAAQVVYVVGSYPRSVTAADFDGDGHLDLVTANVHSDAVSVLRNLGDGTFAAQKVYAVGSNLTSVTAADFDGDGHVDIATANAGSNTVSVLRNLGDGTSAVSPDLIVTLVTVAPNAVDLGQALQVGYELRNIGLIPAEAGWVDSIYLSRNATFDISDSLLTRVPRNISLAPGERHVQTITATVPFFDAFVPGDWHIIVRTDSGHDVVESRDANNTGVSVPLAIDKQVTSLTLGESLAATIAAGQSQYFQVSYAAGDPLAFRLEGLPTDGTVELYIDRDGLPSRTDFDRTSRTPFATEQSIYLPAQAQSGTFYVLVHARTLAIPTASFKVTAYAPVFSVLTRSFGTAGNAGDYTLRAIGTNLGDTIVARIVTGQGVELEATSTYVRSETDLYATFDLRGVAPGAYDVVFIDAAGARVTIPQSLVIVGSSESNPVIPRVIVPTAIRRNSTFSFTVEWENTSLNDAIAPLLTVGAPTPFGLKQGDYSLGTRYTYLGISTQNGPPGILLSGQRESLTFWAYSGTEAGDYTVFVDRMIKDTATPLDWEQVRDRMRPFDEADDDFQSIFDQVIRQVGTAGGDFLKMLARNANLIPPSSGDPRDFHDLLSIEVQFARTAITNSISGTAVSLTSSLNAPGLEVTAQHQQTGQQFASRILQDGRFAIPNLPSGTYDLAVERAIVQNDSPITVNEGTQVFIGDVQLKIGAVIKGRVLSDNGAPISDARLVATQLDGSNAVSYEGFSRIDGSFEIAALPPGIYGLDVRAAGHQPLRIADLDLTAPEAVAIRSLSLAEGVERSFEIRDATTGLPLVEAMLSATRNQLDGFSMSGISDASGRVMLNELSSDWWSLSVARTGYVSKIIDVDLSQSGGPIIVALERVVAFTGRVVDGNGNGLGGIELSLGAIGDLSQVAKTTSTGDFLFSNLDTRTYILSVLSDGIPVWQQGVDLTNGAPQNFKLTLPVSTRIAGNVKDSTGAIVSEGEAILTDDAGNVVLSSNLDLAGGFEFLLMVPGRYGLSIYSPHGFGRLVVVDATATNSSVLRTDVVLGNFSIAGKILQSSGAAAAGQVVSLQNAARHIIAQTTSASDGGYHFSGIPNGDYHVASAFVSSVWSTAVNVDGASVNLGELQPEVLHSSTILVKAGGVPIEGALVLLEQDDAIGASVFSNELGEAVVWGPGNSTYKVRVISSNHLREVVANVAAGDIIQVDLSQPTTTVEGRILNSQTSAAIVSANVLAYDSLGNVVGVAESDEDGRFVLRSLPAEAVLLDIQSVGFSRITRTPLDLAVDNTKSGLVFELAPIAFLASQETPSFAPLSASSLYDLVGLTGNWFDDYWATLQQRPPIHLSAFDPNCTEQAVAALEARRAVETVHQLWLKLQTEKVDDYEAIVNSSVKKIGIDLALLAISAVTLKYNVGLTVFILTKNFALSPTFRAEMGHLTNKVLAAIGLVVDTAEALRKGEVSTLNALATITNAVAIFYQWSNELEIELRLLDEQLGREPRTPDFSEKLKARKLLQDRLAKLAIVTEIVAKCVSIWEQIKLIDQSHERLLTHAANYINAHSIASQMAADVGNVDCGDDNDPDDEGHINRPASFDPNDIIGPAGYGQGNHIVASSVMPYTIRFENDPEKATAPAAMVTITQTLDTDLDWTTFRLGEMGFGDKLIEVPNDSAFFETRYDATVTLGVFVDITAGINIATGEVRWEFVAIDPLTGDLPESPFVGFLYPNKNAPEGEGFVNYTVRPKSGVTTGDRVDAVASIVFDANDPIVTPAIFNTFDIARPTSGIDPLPAVTNTANFAVTWTGGDEGSGVAAYDVFVSVDGGPFTPWLHGTTLTSAQFTGPLGHAYAFYTVARDGVGHRQVTSASASAQTLARSAWWNENNPGDVNSDGHVSGIDLVLVIAGLNSMTESVLPLPAMVGHWIDVNGDGHISGIDLILVVAELNMPIPLSALASAPATSFALSAPLDNPAAAPEATIHDLWHVAASVIEERREENASSALQLADLDTTEAQGGRIAFFASGETTGKVLNSNRGSYRSLGRHVHGMLGKPPRITDFVFASDESFWK